MKATSLPLIGLCLWFVTGISGAQSNPVAPAQAPLQPVANVLTTNDLGLATNGPVIVRLLKITQTRINDRTLPLPNPVLSTNPAYLRMRQSGNSWTNAVFENFRPESLSYAIWTNFIARTNGRTTQIWSERSHPRDWPATKPSVRWNTNNLMWGMKGLTALSPCWQDESYPGQVPLTALTRRHAYTRGHGMGPDGFRTNVAGHKAWFLTRDNVLVEAVINRHVTRASTTNGVHLDYTLFLFEKDLPDTIEPIAAAPFTEVEAKCPFPARIYWPYPIFQTEQSGSVSAGVAPFIVNTWKAGDSGSPNMLPLPDELVFFGGRSTSGPSREMQEDMDELSRQEGLDPKKYQLHHPDLSKYPSY